MFGAGVSQEWKRRHFLLCDLYQLQSLDLGATSKVGIARAPITTTFIVPSLRDT